MTTRLVLVLDLSKAGDADEQRAYGEKMLDAIRARQAAGIDSLIEWGPEQLVDARIESDES